jgi:hypothetical protein
MPFLLVAEYLAPNVKALLRENKIGYLDVAGNIYFPAPEHFIWIDGQKALARQKPTTNRAFTKTGLRMVYFLLLFPEAIDWPYRQLAETTGVALGNIKNIMEGLKEAGYTLPLDKKRVRLQNRMALLVRWMAGYQETLKPALHIGTFRFRKQEPFADRQQLPGKLEETVWGGEPAEGLLTRHLTPEVYTAYTGRPTADLLIKWGLIPDENGNVQIYQKFWNDVEWDQQRLAPPLLIYADLMLTGDPRCLEAANLIYQQYLKDELD